MGLSALKCELTSKDSKVKLNQDQATRLLVKVVWPNYINDLFSSVDFQLQYLSTIEDFDSSGFHGGYFNHDSQNSFVSTSRLKDTKNVRSRRHVPVWQEKRNNGCDPFNENSNWSDREKWSTSKGGPVFSKLFRLDRTDPLSFGPKFSEILVEWIAPNSPRYGTVP